MNPTVRLEPANDVPEQATVRDYDELPTEARTALPRMATPDEVALDCERPCAFTDGVYVKFTDYYRVVVGE